MMHRNHINYSEPRMLRKAGRQNTVTPEYKYCAGSKTVARHTLVFLCLHAPQAVDIFRDFDKAGEGEDDGWPSDPSEEGRGAIGRDIRKKHLKKQRQVKRS